MLLITNIKAVLSCAFLLSLALLSNNTQAQSSITGTLTLPTGVVSDGSITIETRLTEIPFARSEQINYTIPSGENSLSFNFNLIEPFLVDKVIITFRCIETCLDVDGQLRTLFYLQNNGTIDYISNSVPLSDVPDTLNLQFPEPPEIESLMGTISLPAGVISEGDFSVSSDIEVYDENGNEIPDTGFFGVSIPSGSDNAPYTMRYQELETGYQVAIYFGCFFNLNCAKATNSLNDLFYLQDDGSFSTDFNTIPASDMPSTLDFQFAPVNTLSGTFSLPSGIVSDGKIISVVQIIEYDSDGNQVDGAFIRETVPLGSSQKPYSFGYLKPNPNNEIAISFGCDRCIEVVGDEPKTYYLQDDGSFNTAFNTIPVADVPSVLDFKFPETALPFHVSPGVILLLLN